MKYLLIVALLFFSLSCYVFSPTETVIPLPLPTGSPTSVPSATPQIAFVTAYALKVHTGPDADSEVTGYLLKGASVTIDHCKGDWCLVESGWVWRGCLSIAPEGAGCEAK